MDDEHIEPNTDTARKIELSIAIPFYNEEPNVASVLEEMISAFDKNGISFEILAVDNGSSDGTSKRINDAYLKDNRVVPLKVASNIGYGFGILTGMKKAKGRVSGYTWGDGQVKAEDLLRIYYKLKDEKAEVSKALRVERHDGFFRYIQTRCYFFCFALLFQWMLKDPNGCPKLFDRKAFEKIAPTSNGWLLDPEIMIKAKRHGMKIVQTPVVFLKRERGRSKVSILTGIGFFLGLLKMRFTKH